MTFRRVWNASFFAGFVILSALLAADFSTPFIGYGAGVGTACASWAFCNLIREWNA